MGYLSIEIRKGFPLYSYHDRPEFGKDIHAKNKYIERELRRLHEGWEGLTGFDYFDLAKNKMHAADGSIFNPDFLYDQKEINDMLLWCKNHKLQEKGFDPEGDAHPVIINGNTVPDPYDFVCIKPRRFGWTSKVSSFILYHAWLMEGCSQGATSCDDGRLKELVSDKLFYSKEACLSENLLTPDGGRWNSKFISFVFNNGGEIKKSTIWTPNTSIDDRAAQSPEGFGYTTYFLDEWFLHPRADIVTQSVKSTLLNRRKQKEGIMIRGGSCNEMNKDAIQQLKNLLITIKSLASKTKLKFVPGWSCQVVNEFGFTMKDQSMEKKLKEREELRKAAMSGNSTAWSAYANEIKSFPFSLDELTGIVESDYFSPSIIQNLDKGKHYNFNFEPRRCNIVNRNDNVFPDDEIKVIPELILPKDTKYPYAIYEAPIPTDTYIAGCDPILFNGAAEKGSMFALVIKNQSKNKYVASAVYRTSDTILGYNLWRNLLLMYRSQMFPHGALCMGEKNALASIITSCQMNGTLQLLAKDPFKTSKSNTDLGYHKTMETMPRIMQYGRLFLENNYVPFDDFNDAFKEYKDDNSQKNKKDICDAFLSCELLSNTFFREVHQEVKPRRRMVQTRDQFGRITEYPQTIY